MQNHHLPVLHVCTGDKSQFQVGRSSQRHIYEELLHSIPQLIIYKRHLAYVRMLGKNGCAARRLEKGSVDGTVTPSFYLYKNIGRYIII